MGPREHTSGLFLIEEVQAHEQPQDGATERLRQPRRVLRRPRDEGAVGLEPTVGDQPMQVRMPVGA